jgi:hypothetical protein
MSVTYRIAIDTDDDGQFVPAEDIAVLEARWRLGMNRPFDAMAAPVRAQLTVRNTDGHFSPERGPLRPAQSIRIESDDGSPLPTIHFTGRITHIEPLAGDERARTAIIYAAGPERWIQQNRVHLPSYQTIRTDEAIDRVLDACTLRLNQLTAHCIVNLSGFNEIDRVWVYGATNIDRDFEIGQTTFDLLGDAWTRERSAWDIIGQIVAAERGRFYIDRRGRAVFLNRIHDATFNLIRHIFEDDMEDLHYSYGEDIANRVEVTFTPRTIGPPDSRLWTLGEPQRLRPGVVRQFVARYADDTGAALGALDVLPPLRNRHYTATLNPDGTGGDRTQAVTVVLTERGSGSALVEIRSDASTDVYLQTLILRGTPIQIKEPITVVAQDDISLHFYGLSRARLGLPLLADIETAEAVAQTELERRATPRGAVRQMTISNRTHPDAVRDLRVFQQITVREAQTGHDADYVVAGMEHTVDQGGYRHRATLLLEPLIL